MPLQGNTNLTTPRKNISKYPCFTGRPGESITMECWMIACENFRKITSVVNDDAEIDEAFCLDGQTIGDDRSLVTSNSCRDISIRVDFLKKYLHILKGERWHWSFLRSLPRNGIEINSTFLPWASKKIFCFSSVRIPLGQVHQKRRSQLNRHQSYFHILLW